ncbi:MAG: hypothetical protein ACLFUQ_04245 [Candidatus Izemoplasmataceae bacterium]
MTLKHTILRLTLYLVGFLLSALGIVMVLRSGLGAVALNTLTTNFSVVSDITIGTGSLVVNGSIMMILVLYHKNPKYFITVIPIAIIASSIDFWDIIVFGDYEPGSVPMQVFWFLGGSVVLTSGIAMTLLSDYPVMVFDELTLIVMKIFKSDSFLLARLGLEFSAITLGAIIGLTGGIGLGAVNFGSFLLTLMLPPLIARELTLFRKAIPFKLNRT